MIFTILIAMASVSLSVQQCEFRTDFPAATLVDGRFMECEATPPENECDLPTYHYVCRNIKASGEAVGNADTDRLQLCMDALRGVVPSSQVTGQGSDVSFGDASVAYLVTGWEDLVVPDNNYIETLYCIYSP